MKNFTSIVKVSLSIVREPTSKSELLVGFSKLRNMHLFPDLKCLYFEQNGCTELSGLDTNTKMVCLYMHENAISKIENLNTLTELKVLNLSDNLITKVENLENNTQLDSLYLARNRIGQNGIDDLRGLLECQSLVSLDIQNNRIDDPAVMEEIFYKLPNLRVLYL